MITCILAAGMGKRMNSNLPKALTLIIDPDDINKKIPMIIYLIKTCILINSEKIFIICSKNRELIENTIIDYYEKGEIIDLTTIEYVFQEKPLGTAHAIFCVLPYLEEYIDQYTLILNADVPLLSINTLNSLIKLENTLLITEINNPFGYGRIIIDKNLNLEKIIEEKDCVEIEKDINLINCGVYHISVELLLECIPLINNNNNAQEYFLTDIINILYENNNPINYYILPKEFVYEIKNVNTKEDLDELNNIIIDLPKLI